MIIDDFIDNNIYRWCTNYYCWYSKININEIKKVLFIKNNKNKNKNVVKKNCPVLGSVPGTAKSELGKGEQVSVSTKEVCGFWCFNVHT